MKIDKDARIVSFAKVVDHDEEDEIGEETSIDQETAEVSDQVSVDSDDSSSDESVDTVSDESEE